MEELSKRIQEVISLRREYETKRQRLDSEVRDLFHPEFEIIKSKMPEGYEIIEFNVYDGFVSIDNPTFNGEIVNHRNLDNLNEILNEEFQRIEKKYGFKTRFEIVKYIW